MELKRGDSDVAVLLEQPGLPATVNQPGQITFEHDGELPQRGVLSAQVPWVVHALWPAVKLIERNRRRATLSLRIYGGGIYEGGHPPRIDHGPVSRFRSMQ
ncbi:hypothetical protein HY522_09765 [bacterium]|nr:hypothetical protein [bacterium]